jgi:3-dehydroquinate dehydratase
VALAVTEATEVASEAREEKVDTREIDLDHLDSTTDTTHKEEEAAIEAAEDLVLHAVPPERLAPESPPEASE